MFIFESMDEKLVEKYPQIYNQSTLKSVRFDGDGTYILEFHTDNLKYALEVSAVKYPNLNLEYLKGLDKAHFDEIMHFVKGGAISFIGGSI